MKIIRLIFRCSIIPFGFLGFNKSKALVALVLRKFIEFFAPTMLANFSKLLIYKVPVNKTRNGKFCLERNAAIGLTSKHHCVII